MTDQQPPRAPEPPAPSGRRFESVLGRVFLAILLVVALLVAAEVTSRWMAARHERLGFVVDRVLKPYTMFGVGRSDRSVNRLGYRGPAPDMPKKDEFRIVVLGASTVFMGDPTVPELIEKQLRERGYDRVRVYNFGINASSSGMELARLAFEVGDVEPDLVIMYNGGNDITTPFLYDPRPGYPMNFVVYESNPMLQSDLSVYPAWTLFAYGSNLARLLFQDDFTERFMPIGGLRAKVKYGSEEWRQEIARIYVGNLVKAGKIAKGYDTEFIAFFQPNIYFKNRLSPEEERFLEKMKGFLAAQKASGDFAEHNRDMRERVRAEIAKAGDGASIVDLSGLFEDSDEWIFDDFVHIRQAGNEKTATAIVDELLANPEIRAKLEAKGESSPSPSSAG